MGKIVAKTFSSDKEMSDWLVAGDFDEIKEKYSPSEYKAEVHLADRQVIVEKLK
jgi:hypothetical protein